MASSGEMSTKDKFLDASAELFAIQGYSGTGLKQIVGQSGATWGSAYHFFPGGKDQLGAEAVLLAGRRDDALFKQAFARTKSLKAAISLIFRSEAKQLRDSGYTYGCTVASVASDVAATSDQIREACSEAFGWWHSTISSAFQNAGIERKESDRYATLVLSALEGATLLSRTHRSVKPMTDALVVICDLLDIADCRADGRID